MKERRMREEKGRDSNAQSKATGKERKKPAGLDAASVF